MNFMVESIFFLFYLDLSAFHLLIVYLLSLFDDFDENIAINPDSIVYSQKGVIHTHYAPSNWEQMIQNIKQQQHLEKVKENVSQFYLYIFHCIKYILIHIYIIHIPVVRFFLLLVAGITLKRKTFWNNGSFWIKVAWWYSKF